MQQNFFPKTPEFIGKHCDFLPKRGQRNRNLGDSRIYRLRGGRLERLSRDHTQLQRLLDMGLIDP